LEAIIFQDTKEGCMIEMKFEFKIKEPVTVKQMKAIDKEIEQANKDYHEKQKKIYKKTTGFVMKKLQTFPFIQQLALSSEWFSNPENKIIKSISFAKEKVEIEIDDALINDIELAESIGSAQLGQAVNYAKRVLGTDVDYNRYSMTGFRRFLAHCLVQNGVVIDSV
jgi:hypothetical protein